MKQLFRLVCLLCAACLLFSACGGSVSSLPASSFEEAGQPQAADPFSQGTLTLASSPSGVLGSQYTSTPNGCYEILKHNDYYDSLLYIDYATRQRVYLSDNPTANHKDESDPSYVGDTHGGLYQFFVDGKLYLYKCTSPLVLEINDYKPEYLSCIMQMDPDGRNRKTLFTVPAGAYINATSAFAYDGGALYFMMDELDEKGERAAVSIMRVDTATGQSMALHTFTDEANARYYLVGAHGGSLVLKRLTLSTPKGQYPTTEEWLRQTHSLLLYCPATGQMKELRSWTQNEIDGFCHQDGFYYIDAAASLMRLDLFTGEAETLLAQITDPDTGSPYDYVDAYKIYDGRLLLQTSDESREHSDYLAFKLDDASLTKLTLYEDDGFASIWGESETEFLVKTGRIYFSQRMRAPGGSLYLLETDVPDFSMIAKEDYWNNIPNFIPIEDHVFTGKIID